MNQLCSHGVPTKNDCSRCHALECKQRGEITSNAELEPGEYYHCFGRHTGEHSIELCYAEREGMKSLGDKRTWAMDDNNQALAKWRIFGPIETPEIE